MAVAYGSSSQLLSGMATVITMLAFCHLLPILSEARNSVTHQCPSGSTDCPATVPTYVGCFSESILNQTYFTHLGESAIYFGNSQPANFNPSLAQGLNHHTRFFAMAKVNVKSGFGYAFNTSTGKW